MVTRRARLVLPIRSEALPRAVTEGSAGMARFILLLAGIAIAALAVWHPVPRTSDVTTTLLTSAPDPSATPASRPSSAATASAVVYVVGAVARPGLYRIPVAARAADAIARAGGLTASADPAAVNLAAHVGDGDEIDVPLLGERTTVATRHVGRSRATRTRRPRGARRATSVVVSINGADASALARVPGIGPTIAARIVAMREQQGPFQSFDELLDVAGFSQSRLDRAQPYLSL